MNKSIAVISSSSRKGGNSNTLCEQFSCGASEAGNTVTKINLREKQLNLCHACYACK